MLALLLFVVSIAYVPGLPSSADAGRWAAMVGSIALLWTVKVHMTRGHWLGLAFLAWCALSLAWTVTPDDTVGGLARLVLLAAVFCVAAETANLDACWAALALGMTASLPFAVAQLLGHQPVDTAAPYAAVGLFLTKNGFADVAVLASIGALMLPGRLRWLSIGPLACVLIAIVGPSSPSRTSWVALAAGATVVVWPDLDRRWRNVVAASWSVPVGVGCWVLMFGQFNRFDVWSSAWINLTWNGWGLESFGWLERTYEFAHNEYLQFAVELGVGALFLAGVFSNAITWAGAPRRELAAMAAFLVQAAFWFPLHVPTSAMVGALLAGHLCGARARHRHGERCRGTPGARSADDARPDGHGPLHAAGFCGEMVSVRSQHQMGA